ncbi:MAG: winged helix-turn-helix domain-containing protein [Bdellovibrionaceae bacterium]|nr:winged helix-turn-helix domain-containing protein [Pseudobdellovibrionaceae bacterium]
MERQNLGPKSLPAAKVSLQGLKAVQEQMDDLGTEAHAFYQLGNLYYDRLDFSKALFYLKKAAKVFLKEQQFEQYFFCQHKCLRIFVEREEKEEIAKLQKELSVIQGQYSLEENSRYYYTLGLSLDSDKQFSSAFSCMEKSLDLALKTKNKVDICYALSGLVIIYTHQDKLDLAIKEINNLKVFFQKIELKELAISMDIAYGYILRQQGLLKDALNTFWQTYSKVGEVKNLYYNTYLLYALGTTYLQLKDKETASLFLSLAQSSVDRKNLKRTAGLIDSHIKSIGVKHGTEFDLILDCHNRQIKEKEKGVVNLKGQFIILELLKLFLSKPGYSFSKKELVKKVWDQNYSPSIHDNKVYVTLKRLKKIIEPDKKSAKYIFRNKEGYYLDSKVKTFIREIQF